MEGGNRLIFHRDAEFPFKPGFALEFRCPSLRTSGTKFRKERADEERNSVSEFKTTWPVWIPGV